MVQKFPFSYSTHGVAYGIAIFDDVFALGDVAQGELMTSWDIHAESHFFTIHICHETGSQWLQRHSNAVSWIYLQEFLHF